QVLSISAEEGRFLALKDSPDTIVLRLLKGQIVQDTGSGTPRVLTFSRHDLPIDLPAIEKFRQRGGKDREYILPELLRIGWSKGQPQDARVASQATFNYRMVEVIMMLLLPLLAVALAIPPKRSTSALGLFVSIVLIVAYHKINQYGQAVGALGRVDPILALWGPFALFAALILWMYWRVAYVPGGQAIGWLEVFAANVTKRVRAIMDKRRKQPVLPGVGI
ncbi:MAG: LptF/LptG family permease, partial [Novosphingobium sp.]|nr:LptF/LptG family permease [Novosphingobium sp.]